MSGGCRGGESDTGQVELLTALYIRPLDIIHAMNDTSGFVSLTFTAEHSPTLLPTDSASLSTHNNISLSWAESLILTANIVADCNVCIFPMNTHVHTHRHPHTQTHPPVKRTGSHPRSYIVTEYNFGTCISERIFSQIFYSFLCTHTTLIIGWYARNNNNGCIPFCLL